MSNKRELKTVGTEIHFRLTRGEFTEIVEDLDGNMELLEPKIRFDKDIVIVNQADIAMLVPSDFFEPPIKPTMIRLSNLLKKVDIVILGAVIIAIGYFLKSPNALWTEVFLGFMIALVVTLGMFCSWALHEYKKHSKIALANYCKSKIICILYLNELDHVNDENNDLESDRSTLIRELKLYRGMYRNLYGLADEQAIMEHHSTNPEFASRAPAVVAMYGDVKKPS